MAQPSPQHSQPRREIPDHLRPFIVTQDPSLYTPIDHAAWRFILRISKAFFAKHAAAKYLAGLEETGISSERIPLIAEMDERLTRFGWRAVAVSGFIPPSVFMEFLSLGILPIACDMRSLEHLAYTPAPDIVHEAAGHAPMIADPQYEAYLRAYGEISRKAITSDQDIQVYYAIRNLSDVKESPTTRPAQAAQAQRLLDEALAQVTYVSESALLARMNWWTIEYGLLGTTEAPLIYGAGLLSSVGESYHCLGPAVKKVPFSLKCIEVAYDITRPQPQLFVTPDFSTLVRELEAMADTMAFRRGGREGLEKALAAATTTTTELDSGLQISGRLSEVLYDRDGRPCHLQFKGPTQLALEEQELQGHGTATHREGFGSPVGEISVGSGTKSPADLTAEDIRSLRSTDSGLTRLQFTSGITVEGELTQVIPAKGNRHAILSFEKCVTKLGERVLFDPAWGTYDMACGSRVTSVFGGAADRSRYPIPPDDRPPARQKTNLTERNRELNALYGRIRAIREKRTGNGPGKNPETAPMTSADAASLSEIHDLLATRFPGDWLARFELLELAPGLTPRPQWEQEARRHLDAMKTSESAELIRRGIETLGAESGGPRK